MNQDYRCGNFMFANKSSSNETSPNESCDKFLKKSKNKAKNSQTQNESVKCETPPGDFISSSSISSTSSGLMAQRYCTTTEPVVKVPNISHELAVAKSALQQLSPISGDNLFDHLSDIIKRVIDERPPNVIDFFEEFSRNVREQKYHLPERFPPHAVFKETHLYKMAKKQLISMNLPHQTDLLIPDEDDLEEEHSGTDILRLNVKSEILENFHTFNDRVQHLQFFWNQCGFDISSEDIFQLACSMNFLQAHPSIIQCRFWGIINGLKASYYIVEAILTNDEYQSRLLQMQKEIQENIESEYLKSGRAQKIPSHIGPELTPGAVGWENNTEAEIFKMKSQALPVPLAEKLETLDIPPEPIGRGVNRYSYFVVNSLTDEWIELPIVTPRQICASREIKKFFTGDLEEEIVSYPSFNGKEKHYLRAMIARITAGSYIAPINLYRKMTEKERRLYEGNAGGDNEDINEDDEEDKDDSQSSEETENKEEELDNDIVLLKNENYDSSVPLKMLNNPEKWVHVRPNILLQGRVVWYNQEKSERQKAKEDKDSEKTNSEEKERPSFEKTQSEDSTDEDESDYSDDNEDREEEELQEQAEKGPSILTPCSQDRNSAAPVPWVGRFTSKFTNQNERILVMQSNIWPGACTFVFKDLCESIYLGWGHKIVSRNMTWKHLPPIQDEYKHKVEDFIESLDPSVEMEETYQSSLLRKELIQEETITIKLDDYEHHGTLESSDDDDDDDDDEEEEE